MVRKAARFVDVKIQGTFLWSAQRQYVINMWKREYARCIPKSTAIRVGSVAIKRQSAVSAGSAGPLQRVTEAQAWQLVKHLVSPRPALLFSLMEPLEKRVLVLKLLPVLGNQIVVLIAKVFQTVVVAVFSLVEAMQKQLLEGLQSLLQ